MSIMISRIEKINGNLKYNSSHQNGFVKTKDNSLKHYLNRKNDKSEFDYILDECTKILDIEESTKNLKH